MPYKLVGNLPRPSPHECLQRVFLSETLRKGFFFKEKFFFYLLEKAEGRPIEYQICLQIQVFDGNVKSGQPGTARALRSLTIAFFFFLTAI